jgi:hypothetical protein
VLSTRERTRQGRAAYAADRRSLELLKTDWQSSRRSVADGADEEVGAMTSTRRSSTRPCPQQRLSTTSASVPVELGENGSCYTGAWRQCTPARSCSDRCLLVCAGLSRRAHTSSCSRSSAAPRTYAATVTFTASCRFGDSRLLTLRFRAGGRYGTWYGLAIKSRNVR